MKTTPTCNFDELEGIDPGWHWHAHTLLALRRRLHRERDTQISAAAETSQSHAADQAAAAADEAEREVIFSELSAESNALGEVEAALVRLRFGNYGICEKTGRAIPPERLRAVPWARFVREVAEREEKRIH